MSALVFRGTWAVTFPEEFNDPLSLPATMRRKIHHFRRDLTCVYLRHAIPAHLDPATRMVVFIRDPRDSVPSHMRRFGHVGFSWVQLFAKRWNNFVQVLHGRPNVGFFRFEDYKSDAPKTLRAIADFCGLEPAEADIEAAVQWSSSAFFAETEKIFSEHYAHIKSPYPGAYNTGGKVRGWEGDGERVALAAQISAIAKHSMNVLGYRD